MPDDQAIEEHLSPEVRKLIELMNPDPFMPQYSEYEQYASFYLNFTVGGQDAGWEVEWTGYNQPGHPNICEQGATLAETCQKVIDKIEADRA